MSVNPGFAGVFSTRAPQVQAIRAMMTRRALDSNRRGISEETGKVRSAGPRVRGRKRHFSKPDYQRPSRIAQLPSVELPGRGVKLVRCSRFGHRDPRVRAPTAPTDGLRRCRPRPVSRENPGSIPTAQCSDSAEERRIARAPQSERAPGRGQRDVPGIILDRSSLPIASSARFTRSAAPRFANEVYSIKPWPASHRLRLRAETMRCSKRSSPH